MNLQRSEETKQGMNNKRTRGRVSRAQTMRFLVGRIQREISEIWLLWKTAREKYSNGSPCLPRSADIYNLKRVQKYFIQDAKNDKVKAFALIQEFFAWVHEVQYWQLPRGVQGTGVLISQINDFNDYKISQRKRYETHREWQQSSRRNEVTEELREESSDEQRSA